MISLPSKSCQTYACTVCLAGNPSHTNGRIAGLLAVLEEANVVLNQRGPDLADYQRDSLLSILEGYTTLLNKLRAMCNENHTLIAHESNGLGSQARRMGKRMLFDATEVKDCRQQIIHYNAMLCSFIGLLNTLVGHHPAPNVTSHA